MKKFEITGEFKIVLDRKLFRIRALVNFGNVKSGDLGGYVEKEENLSHDGNAWVYGNAQVFGNARLYGNALVCGEAQVFGNARVSANAQVYGNAKVCGEAQVRGDADYACVKGFGSEFRNTTFFRTTNGNIGVKCGCFYGALDAFREKVKETHGDTKYAKEYLMIADLMKMHFDGGGQP